MDGIWYDLDPTLGQDKADATHITLILGDFEKLIELFRIVGRLRIHVLDVKYEDVEVHDRPSLSESDKG